MTRKPHWTEHLFLNAQQQGFPHKDVLLEPQWGVFGVRPMPHHVPHLCVMVAEPLAVHFGARGESSHVLSLAAAARHLELQRGAYLRLVRPAVLSKNRQWKYLFIVIKTSCQQRWRCGHTRIRALQFSEIAVTHRWSKRCGPRLKLAS